MLSVMMLLVISLVSRVMMSVISSASGVMSVFSWYWVISV